MRCEMFAGISSEARRLGDRYDTVGAQAATSADEITKAARQLRSDIAAVGRSAPRPCSMLPTPSCG